MNIGIIIHSFTGNTLSVAEKIKTILIRMGHTVKLEKLKIAGGEQQNMTEFKIEDAPDANSYDAVIFGAPVRAFQASPVIVSYLKDLRPLNGKKCAVLVTQHFPYAWMGGNNAVKKIKKLCAEKGAIVCGAGIVNWSGKKRDEMIEVRAEAIVKSIL